MNEKMMILDMLQKGKITAEEASKLLSTVEDAPASAPGMDSAPLPNSNRPAPPPSSGSGIDFDELGRKFASFAKDLEPKIQKATEVVAEKTVFYADKLARGLESAGASVAASGHRNTATPSPSGADGTEKQVELIVDDGYNELSLGALNGLVHIKGYNGDKISARIRYKSKLRNPSIELMKLGSKYYLSYEEDNFEFVAIDAYVPSHKFKVINITGMNGQVDISGLSADSIKCESGNGRLAIKNITANTVVFDHYNGAVEAGEIDAEKLSLTNFNGPISLYTSAFAQFNEYLWNVETSNAKLTLNVPTLPNLGYHVRAHDTLGSIRVGLTGLEFITNDPGFVEAQTGGFSDCTKKVRLSLETSNAQLTVN